MIIVFEGNFPEPVTRPCPGRKGINVSVWNEGKEVCLTPEDELGYYRPDKYREFVSGEIKLVCLPKYNSNITLPKDHIKKLFARWEKDRYYLNDNRVYIIIHNNDLPTEVKKTLENINREGNVIYFTHGGSWYKELSKSIIDCTTVVGLFNAYCDAIAKVKKEPKRILFKINDDCFNTVYLNQHDFDAKTNLNPLSKRIKILNNWKPNLFSYPDDAFTNFDYFNGPDGDNLTRLRRYIDSSIWNMAVHEEDDIAPLLLQRNYKNGLYGLTIAKEYYELHKRILDNSYIEYVDGKAEDDKSGHAEDVSPFVFHSEAYMRYLIDERYKCNLRERLKCKLSAGKSGEVENVKSNSTLKLYKWRILLCDDHADNPLSGYNPCQITKSRIIHDVLTDAGFKVSVVSFDKDAYLKSYESSDADNIIIHCASSIDIAARALQNYKYEIVLMDYLFKEKDGKSYGYEMLNALVDKKNEICIPKRDIYKFGPHGRLYFSFISAFTTAVNERLLAEGLHKSEKFWHIADGACPTNTPYLFLYNLLHLMNKRVEDMGIHKLLEIRKDKFENSWIKENIVNVIYGKEDNKGKDVNVRKMANETFDEVLSLLYHYKKLLDDVHNTDNVFESNGSVLATDFVKKNPNLGGFLEHLTQLVYLTAFGTVRQWPEMWEEYQFINYIVGPQPKIEEYIMKLKSNNI